LSINKLQTTWLQSSVYKNWSLYHVPILSENWLHDLLDEELPIKNDDEDDSLLRYNDDGIVLIRSSDIGDLVAKLCKVDSLIGALSNKVSHSRSKQTWLNGQYLMNQNIDTPEPLAFIEQRKNGLTWSSWLICRYHPGTSCDDYFVHSASFTPAMVNSAAAIVALFIKMRDKQLSHGNLTSINVRIANGQPCLIGLDDMQHHKNVKKADAMWRKDIHLFMDSWRERYDIYKKFQQAFLKHNIKFT
jgi:hypothetical protein